jgi:hypothetical protein
MVYQWLFWAGVTLIVLAVVVFLVARSGIT